MDRFSRSPPQSGGPRSPSPNLRHVLLLSLFIAALLLGSFATMGPSIAGSVHAAPASAPAPIDRATVAAVVHPATHGDLVVGPENSPFNISPATTGSGFYAQAGNITVLPGGTLNVNNEVLTIYSFVGTSGPIGERLSHIYSITVEGTARFTNTTLTTDDLSLNAYPKLAFNVTEGGQVFLNHTAFEFPGWVNVFGAGSQLQLNDSNLSKNPTVPTQTQNWTILHDAMYGPSLTITGGASAMLSNSAVLDSYKVNTTQWGNPVPAPVFSNGDHTLSNAGGSTWTNWNFTLADTENLSRDILAHSAVSGSIILNYTVAADVSIPSGSSVLVGSTLVALPAMSFPAAGASTVVPMPSAMLGAVNATGLAAFYSNLTLNLGATNSATALTIASAVMTFQVALPYNITVAGPGSRLSAINTAFDLNWNLTPGTSVVPATQYPWSWGSNKLNVLDGASVYLANTTILQARQGLYWNTSAVLPDASSTAVFYRWLVIPVSGLGGAPVEGAQGSAFYSYDSNQQNNATATALNDLATADPALYAYVTASAGAAGYGASNAQGQLWMLLASTTMNGGSVPNGVFLGGYHLAVSLPGAGAAATRWSYASVTPYPLGMTPAFPDTGIPVNYANYAPNLAIGSVHATIENLVVTGAHLNVSIGQTLNLSALLNNSGVAPAHSLFANLSYVNTYFPAGVYLVSDSLQFSSIQPSSSLPLNFTWTANQNLTGLPDVPGLHGWVNTSLQLSVVWAGGQAPAGGAVVTDIPLTLEPSHISVSMTAPPTTVELGGEYNASGDVQFNGTGPATVKIYAVNSQGTLFPLGVASVKPGPFTTFIFPTAPMTAGTYTLVVTASFNNRTSAVTAVPGTMTIPGAPKATTPFWEQTYFGLPLWLWIAIAAGIAVGGTLGFLMLSRRAAAGRLVECGECGELIPEDATVCPKCGAEFETGLVRCSRCNSTIPADSKVCPECAAQLLGKPEETAHDPERQGYADFVERYRQESKKELQDNYSEGAFWDWWKRQPTYVAFSQWRLLQSQGSRAGMTAPPTTAGAAAVESVAPTSSTTQPGRQPPRGGAAAPAAAGATAAAARPAAPGAPPARRAAPTPAAAVAPTPPPTAATGAVAPASAASFSEPQQPAGAPTTPGMKGCSNCSKEIPTDYLVCPFCGAVTR